MGARWPLLVHLRGELAARRVVGPNSSALTRNVQALIHLYRGHPTTAPSKAKAPRRRLYNPIPAALHSEFFQEVKGVLAFFGDVVLAALGLLKEPKTGNWGELLPTMERTGADAVPIVILINFLGRFLSPRTQGRGS